MKKPTYENYQKFVSKKKKELLKIWFFKWMKSSRQHELLYGRLMIEIYNKFLKNKDEEQR